MMILVHRVSENIGSIGAKCPAFRAMSWKTTSGRVLLGVIFGVLGSATEGQGGLTNDPSSLNMLKFEYIFPSSWNAICVYFCCTKAMGKLLQRLRRHRSKSMSSRWVWFEIYLMASVYLLSVCLDTWFSQSSLQPKWCSEEVNGGSPKHLCLCRLSTPCSPNIGNQFRGAKKPIARLWRNLEVNP